MLNLIDYLNVPLLATSRFYRNLNEDQKMNLKLLGNKIVVQWVDNKKNKVKTNLGWFSLSLIVESIKNGHIVKY